MMEIKACPLVLPRESDITLARTHSPLLALCSTSPSAFVQNTPFAGDREEGREKGKSGEECSVFS